MQIALLTTIFYPSRVANRVHIKEMCRSLLRAGHRVTFYSENATPDTFLEHDALTYVTRDRGRLLQRTLWYIGQLRQQPAADVWYSREPRLLFLLLLVAWCRRVPVPTVVFEVHDIPRTYWDALIFRILPWVSSLLVVSITNALTEELSQRYPALSQSFITLPDGVDAAMFTAQPTANPSGHVLYTGSLYAWKGVYTVLDAAKMLPDVQFQFVGGRPEEITELQQYLGAADNVSFVSHVPHDQIVSYYEGASILLLPNSAQHDMSLRYTSPLKLFEYLASGIPIIASDNPSIQEIVSDQEVTFFPADDAAALARSIQSILSDYDVARHRATQAISHVTQYTWDERVRQLLASTSTVS